jgi:hypothetical protein
MLLSQVAGFARLNIERLTLRTQAQLLCESKLSEIGAGVEPLRTVSGEQLKGLPGWFYSVEFSPVEKLGLVAVKVTVWHSPEQSAVGGASPVSSETSSQAKFSLVRWVRDPDRATATTQAADLGDGIRSGNGRFGGYRGRSDGGRSLGSGLRLDQESRGSAFGFGGSFWGDGP